MLDLCWTLEIPKTTMTVLKLAGVAWLVHIVFLSIWIILQKRSPVATLGWILALAFLPYIGFLIYHFLGPHKLIKQQFKRLIPRTSLKEHSDYLQGHIPVLTINEHPEEVGHVAELVRKTTGYPLTSAQDLQLLVDGEQTYTAILDAVAQAKHHIHLEYYIFEPDHIGTTLRDLLITKANAGVRVRLLADGLGSSNLKSRFLKPLLDAGAQFAFFHKPHLSQLFKPMVNFRTHRKIVICDGNTGFTGGLNITDEEDERIHPDDAYHDIHLKLTGNAVHWLQMTFLEDWFYATRVQNIPDVRRYFPINPTGPFPVQVIPSGPDNPWEIIHRFYLTIIQRAQHRVWLTTPYFVPTEPTLFALTNAALRGVDVRLLVPKQSDSRLVTYAARSYFGELKAAGVKIWEYDQRMLHSKTIVIDRQYSLIGTANFDNRSFRLNFEICVAGYGEALTDKLAEQFLKDLDAAELVPEQRKISFIARFFEAIARLSSPLL